MKSLYGSPLRVYLLLGLLALIGIYSGLKLPVSLFPNSTKPTVNIHLDYASSSAENFLSSYGNSFESRLKTISVNGNEVEEITSTYSQGSVSYRVEFPWGTVPDEAVRELQSASTALSGQLPYEIRKTLSVNSWNQSGGFFAVSFFSQKRDLDELYSILEPVLTPRVLRVKDAEDPGLFNPNAKEIIIELKPEKLTSLRLMPGHIQAAIQSAMVSFGGGSVTSSGKTLAIQIKQQVMTLEQLRSLPITTPGKLQVHLSDVAQVDLALKQSALQKFKTNGASSLILFSKPKAGGNVKRMSEDIMDVVRSIMPQLPADVEYRVLVDPSEFIGASINNVIHEVFLGAFLAVLVLFVFIGSLRNTITAAIEIPLSIILAFILMRISGMNLNLISLGGLALSAGMNVDASVVVMENIFRHFDMNPGIKSKEERLRIVVLAVKEVWFSVFASTIASLVVFIPLAFTSDLTYAILGDLAKTVVFSHGFSAIVALVLVPTVRLHLMNKDSGKIINHTPPAESFLKLIENKYALILEKFILSQKTQTITFLALFSLLLGLVFMGYRFLPKEIIGKPDTDWIMVGINSSDHTVLKQMDTLSEKEEQRVRDLLPNEVSYTFTQIWGPNGGMIMARLKNKKDMTQVWKKLEAEFKSSSQIQYWVDSWNPAELPLPKPNQLELTLQGGSSSDRVLVGRKIHDSLLQEGLYSGVSSKPGVNRREMLTLDPHWDTLNQFGGTGTSPSEWAQLLRIATQGESLGELAIDGKSYGMFMSFPKSKVFDVEATEAFPITVHEKLLPLKALADIKRVEQPAEILHEDGRELMRIYGTLDQENLSRKDVALKEAQERIKKIDFYKVLGLKSDQVVPTLTWEDQDREIVSALKQLGIAVAISILLIFLTLILQFGDVMSALLVLVSIPLGLIGVLLALLVFKSSLSLNSVLGVILLNGIAVANSIILVDFLRRKVHEGYAPREAALLSARQRLRPILITSLTTVLGMLPIAFGYGDGGKILQPLGIAVSAGLWVSMVLTLFIVPTLQVRYLESSQSKMRTIIPLAVLIVMLGVSFNQPARADESFEILLSELTKKQVDPSIQKLRINQIEASAIPIRLQFLPTLIASGTRSYSGSELNAGLNQGFQYGLSSQLNLFRFGADIQTLRSVNNAVEAENWTLKNQILKSERISAALLLDSIYFQIRARIYNVLTETQTRSYQIAKERYEKGLLPLQELQKIEIDISNAHSRLSDIVQNSVEINSQIESRAGHSVQLKADWPWKNKTENIISQVEANEVPIMDDKPDLKVAELHATAARFKSSAAWRLLFPSLDSSISIGRNYGSESRYGSPVTVWSGALTLTLPLFDHLSKLENARSQSFEAEIADLKYLEVRRVSKSQWSIARARFLSARQTLQERTKTLSLARGIYQDNLKRLQAGRISVNELAQEQQRALDAELLELEGWKVLHLSYMELCHLMGRSVL